MGGWDGFGIPVRCRQLKGEVGEGMYQLTRSAGESGHGQVRGSTGREKEGKTTQKHAAFRTKGGEDSCTSPAAQFSAPTSDSMVRPPQCETAHGFQAGEQQAQQS